MTTIAENIIQVRRAIMRACDRVNRDPAEVTLLAVSKTHPAPILLEAIEAGVQHFGENRVEEAMDKIPAVNAISPVPLQWHMVGHIQRRKATNIPGLFQVVHSVDRLSLAERLSGLVVGGNARLDVLLEVNISGEASKGGLVAANWQTDADIRAALWDVIGQITALPGLHVRGLMMMAPIVTDAEQARPFFVDLANLRRALTDSFALDLPDLSMGMTNDYPVAIEAGATIVRVGRAIFGERNSPH